MREKGWAAGETSAGAVQRSCMLLAAAGLLGCSTSDSMPCGYGLQNHFGVASVPNCCEPLGLGCSHAWDVHMRTSICAVMHGMGTCAQASAQSCMGWAHAHKHLRSHTWDGHMGTNICAAIHGMGTWAQTIWRWAGTNAVCTSRACSTAEAFWVAQPSCQVTVKFATLHCVQGTVHHVVPGWYHQHSPGNQKASCRRNKQA
jgi:hypothetical protein